MFREDDFVRSRKNERWGVGKVLGYLGDDKYRVFFAEEGIKKVAAAVAELEKADASDSDRLLLRKLTVERRTKGDVHTVRAAVDRFRKAFPGGFADPKFQAVEREGKDEAHLFLSAHMTAEILAELTAKNRFDEIRKLLRRVTAQTTVLFPFEQAMLGEGPKDPELMKRFCEALTGLMGGEDFPAAFDKFVGVLISFEAARWSVATYLPFLHDPEQHVFVKPKFVRDLADAFGYDLIFQPDPSYAIYSRVQDFYRFLCRKLPEYGEDLTPRDMIDVQGFIRKSNPDSPEF